MIGFNFTAGSIAFFASLLVAVNTVSGIVYAYKNREWYRDVYKMSMWQVFKSRW